YGAVDKKMVVVPAEAAAVRTIFARYLELGSVRALAQDLDRRGIRSKPRRLSNGRTIGGGCFGVGRSPICSRTASISARWSTGARSTAANRRRLWVVPCSPQGRPSLRPRA